MPRKLKWKRRRLGNTCDWTLHAEGDKLVTATAGRRDFVDTSLELRIILDPRTGKRWTSIKAMRKWLDKAMK